MWLLCLCFCGACVAGLVCVAGVAGVVRLVRLVRLVWLVGDVAGVGYSVWRIATEPNRNSAILAIHIPLNTAYVSVSTEPPDYNH